MKRLGCCSGSRQPRHFRRAGIRRSRRGPLSGPDGVLPRALRPQRSAGNVPPPSRAARANDRSAAQPQDRAGASHCTPAGRALERVNLGTAPVADLATAFVVFGRFAVLMWKRLRREDRRWDTILSSYKEPPLGAHLVSSRCLHRHHGIYVGRGRVIHCSGFAYHLRCRKGLVQEVSLGEFHSGTRDASASQRRYV